MHQPQEHVVKVIEAIQETPQIRVLRVERPNGVEYHAGQFFMVSLVDDPEVKVSRAYSIASSPENKQYLEIGFDKVGVLTTKLFELKVGDKLKFKGPYGKFYFDPAYSGDIILLGAGTGITPLMGILRQCADKKLPNTVKLIYSVRTPEEIGYLRELDVRKSQNRHFSYDITITRPENAHQEWKGKIGRINEALLRSTIAHPSKSIVFICGAKEFVFSMIGLLERIGLTKEQIKTDVWG